MTDEERIKGLSQLKRDVRYANALAHSFSKYWTPEKVALVVEDPKLFKHELNPTLARLLQVEEEYNEACRQEQKEHEKELERVKKEEQKRIEHRRLIWDRAVRMYERKEIPDPLWKTYGNRANPTVIFNFLMGEEGVTI